MNSYTLKELLLSEQHRLENILQETRKRLKDVPPGKLYVFSGKGRVQYYHKLPGGLKNGIYISKSNKALVRRLAQKEYDSKITKLAEKRYSQLLCLTSDYDPDEIEELFLSESPEKQKWIIPVEPLWEQQLRTWSAEIYEGKGFKDELPVILTEKGERVRSKTEKIMADFFYRNDIPYKYEHPLSLSNGIRLYPDFTFLSKKTKKEKYWEHFGLMDDPGYSQSAIRKIYTYIENEIYPGENLIVTFETEKNILDTKTIEKLVSLYLK